MAPASEYPRKLDQILDASDIEYLKKFFHTQVETEWERNEGLAKARGLPKPRRSLEYYTLLRQLQGKPRDASLERIISKLYAVIEKQFGPGFVIVHDFWSWRTAQNVPAEFIHHDPDFWATGHHDGFNLWILLDHKNMAHSFDIFLEQDNPELYRIVKNKAGRLLPEKSGARLTECPGVLFWDPLSWWPVLYEWPYTRTLAMVMGVALNKFWQKSQNCIMYLKQRLPTWSFRCVLGLTGWLFRLTPLPAGLVLKTQRFGLEVGDALVLRQYELHTTDQDPLQDHQFRLAVGVKVVRQGPIVQYCYTGPASRIRRNYPCLRWGLGQVLPDFYRCELDMEPYPETWLTRFLFSATAEKALGDSGAKAAESACKLQL
ncbi:unnamed protein product [Effrenium voratum]|nr:unnamed protein product [Effrenium voratum]